MTKKFVSVSVLIPCFCSSETLSRAVESVLCQTTLPKEIIMIDDASPHEDDTAHLIRNLSKLITITNPEITVKTLFLSDNLGPGGARNAGRKVVSQPWIAFLDSDDAWHPMKLEIQMNWIESHPNAAIIGHEVGLGWGGDSNFHLMNLKSKKISLFEMLISNQLATRSVVIRSDLPCQFAEWKFAEDYYFWLYAISSGYEAYKLNFCMAYFFRPEYSIGGQSGSLWRHEKCEIKTFITLFNQKKIGFFSCFIAIIISLLKFLKRRFNRLLTLNLNAKVIQDVEQK